MKTKKPETLPELVDEIGEEFGKFKQKYDDRHTEHEARIRDLESQAARLDLEPRAGERRPLQGELRKNYAAFIRTGGEQFRNAATIGNDPSGGYLVREEIRQDIERYEQSISPIEQVAYVARPPIGSEWGTILDRGGIASGWVGEQGARSETATPELSKVSVPIGEIYANPRATQNLLDDSGIDVATWLNESIAIEFAAKIGAAAVSGNGFNKLRGFTTYTNVSTADATRAWNEIQYVPTGAASDFITPTTSASPADCLIDLVHSLKAQYRRNAVWLMNSLTLAKVRKMKDGDGAFVVRRGLEEGAPDQLLGYPVVAFEDMPDVGAGTFPVAFGDFRRAYTLVLRDVAMLRDPFTAKPYVQFYTTRRVGGGVTNFQALKLLKVATS